DAYEITRKYQKDDSKARKMVNAYIKSISEATSSRKDERKVFKRRRKAGMDADDDWGRVVQADHNWASGSRAASSRGEGGTGSQSGDYVTARQAAETSGQASETAGQTSSPAPYTGISSPLMKYKIPKRKLN